MARQFMPLCVDIDNDFLMDLKLACSKQLETWIRMCLIFDVDPDAFLEC